MSLYKDHQARRQLIMEHYLHPLHKKVLKGPTIDVYSNACVDELHLQITVENRRIKKAHFDAQGCAIFLSSTDIFLALIINKTLTEVQVLCDHYDKMLKQEQPYDLKLLGKLGIYEDVTHHFNRLQCAQMIYEGLTTFLKKQID